MIERRTKFREIAVSVPNTRNKPHPDQSDKSNIHEDSSQPLEPAITKRVLS